MLVEFLTTEQRRRYVCYVVEPSPEQLALFIFISMIKALLCLRLTHFSRQTYKALEFDDHIV